LAGPGQTQIAAKASLGPPRLEARGPPEKGAQKKVSKGGARTQRGGAPKKYGMMAPQLWRERRSPPEEEVSYKEKAAPQSVVSLFAPASSPGWGG